MAKKQFIRHLEYYGFPDQNGYTSNIGNVDVDLSELKNKDKEHDKEIKCLENEKANKKDLLTLSGTVGAFIETQSQINITFANELSSITVDIETLKEVDNQYGEQLSGLTDGVNDALRGVQNLGNKVNNIEGDLAELSGKVETLSADTQDKFDEISEELDKKADKDELENYATKEWVEEQGYLTQEEGDERYARNETLDALSDRVNNAVTDLNSKIYTVSGDLASFSSSTNARMGVLETNFETLRGEVNRKINEISGTVDSFDDRITQNAEDIDALEDEMARKANQVDLERLQNTVSNLSDLVDTKVGKPEFETYKSLVSNQFNNMDEKKADKTALTEINDAIQETNDRIDQEIADRISGDTYITNQITNINNEIIEIKEQAVDYGDRIEDLEDGLAQEIADRKQADLDLIGHETDDKDDDTIWAAKNFAKNQKRQAVAEANAYTDSKVTEINSRIDQEHEWAEQNFSSAASKAYVESMVNDLEDELETEIENAVTEESDRATAAEEDLLRRIIEVLRALGENDRLLDLLTNRVNAITAWDGTDPSEYDNTGNGVLDVLHREFHEFEQTGGSIKEMRVEDGNLIIVYYTKEGEKEAVIPVADLIDLSNYYTKEETDEKIEEAVSGLVFDYYTKEETDALLDEKLDASAYTDISEQVTANTQNIAILSGAVEDERERAISAETELQNAIDVETDRATSAETELQNAIDAETARATSAETELQNAITGASDALDAIINKLGYTDNDTLVKNGEHEAAFGQYNISNTSEDPSGRTIFSVGNGTDENNRSNAIEIRENGDVYLWVEGDFMNINKLLGQIAHEVYDTDTNSHFFDGD